MGHPPYLPPGIQPGSMPPPPPMGFPGFPPNLPPPPPPPIGFQQFMGPPPLGFFPRREKSASAMQDPLSSVPHQTYQAHRASHASASAHPSLPAKPNVAGPPRPPAPSTSSATTAAATVFAAPQLRDFKKEATAFVPSALKRKRGAAPGSTSRVNAAPGFGDDGNDADHPTGPVRPDLLSTLRDQFGPAPSATKSDQQPVKKAKVETVKKKDDYERFVEDIGDILNP